MTNLCLGCSLPCVVCLCLADAVCRVSCVVTFAWQGVRLATCIKRISSTTQRDPVRLRIKSDAGAAWSSWSSEYELPGEMLIEVKGVHCPFTQP